MIVAIPSEDDYIWKLSSEKVPHVTLLYLDSHFDDIVHATDYIHHVVNTSLIDFYLTVKRRGILGDQFADVLFLDGYSIKMLEDFRGYLLNDPDIFKAYNSVEQYPSWTPHLTLGYPETPAKPGNKDFPGVPHSIHFDRIALWTGDYEGVDFPLNRPDLNSFAMSAARGQAFLEHHGVKGMKWGVIRDKIRGNPAVKYASSSEDHKKAQAVRTKAKIAGVNTLSNKDLQHLIKRMDLEVKFKDLKTVEHNQSLLGKGKKWVGKVVTDILVGAAISWLKRPGARLPHPRETRPHPDRVNYPAWVGRPDSIPMRRPMKAIEGSPTFKAIGK